MGCGNNHNNDTRSGNCVCEVVRAIKDIQDNAVEEECSECSSCFTEPLGTLVSPARREPVDTRVFVLSTADGSPFHAFFSNESNACVSIYFRV
ncbi:MAG: spore coat protein CotZ, partial [Bacillus sp. (in: Bacteria)]|nr:spore coat protein CotZ [Bacillus sp. (in: firmicutes)]